MFSLGRARTRSLVAAGIRAGIAAAIAASCVTLAPRSATAFCRTTTTPIPASFSPTGGCYKEGLALFWRGACVSYSVNSKASADIPLAEARRVIDQAFATWNSVACGATPRVGIATSNIGESACAQVKYNQYGPNQNVVIFRDDGWPYSDPNNTLGLTTVTFNAENGEIFDADMEINSSGKNLSTSDTVPANGFDLLSVITHEAGHFLGLAHATDNKATMFASYKPGTSALRTLSADDGAGLCEIYPTTSARRVDKSVAANGALPADACDATPRHGFGPDSCDGNPAPAESGSSGGCAVVAGPPPESILVPGLSTMALGLLALHRTRRTRRTRRARRPLR